ncbi:MAG: endonuclease/exonuclease/phosphatase family protein [Bacteroidota bacterium]
MLRRIILIIAIGIPGLFIIFLLISTALDYSPPAEKIIHSTENPVFMQDSGTIDFLIWNIGYCGLGDEMDFFYDGGQNVRSEKHSVIENLSSIESFLKQNDTIDFILLQEVDKNSKRSYGINQLDSIASLFPGWNNYYGKNYDVWFVPVPPKNPMGRVNSGLMTLTPHKPVSVERHSFPGNFSWPKNLFFLDRCFLVSRFNLKGKNEMVIINTHNSAYDDGSLRQEQMAFLKKFLLDEYNKGNYIIVGGDWNQSPADFIPNYKYVFDDKNHLELPKNYLPRGWKFVYDEDIPTNRRVKTPFDPESTPTTIIDFFLISPNVEKVHVNTVNLHFDYSDHQPVVLTVKLKA